MKRLAMFCALLALPLFAQEDAGKDLLKQAAELERKAEVLLDQGKRPAAFELLARAAQLRERARKGGKAAPRPKKQPKKVQPPPTKADLGVAKMTPQQATNRALAALDRALKAGNMGAARLASRNIRQALQRERAQRKAATPIERRIASLEQQVRELRRMLDRQRD